MSVEKDNGDKQREAAFGRTVTYEEWLKGRRARRELSRKVGGGVIRKTESSADKRLRKEFDGERGPPFIPTNCL